MTKTEDKKQLLLKQYYLYLTIRNEYNKLLDKFIKGENWFNDPKNWRDNPNLRNRKGEDYIKAFQNIMKQIDEMIDMFEEYDFEISDEELLGGIK